MASEKTCFKCGAAKPLTEFYRHPAMGDGHLGKCKPCARKDVRSNRIAKIDYYADYDAKRNASPERKARAAQSFKAASEKYPERHAAARIVGNALKRGDLQRHPCWVCGGEAQAHHPDYSRPLDVVWLCLRHHRQTHAMVRTMDEEIAA